MITSVVFLVLALYATHFGYKILIRNRRKDLSARKTKAHITEYKKEEGTKGSPIYYPIFKFQNEAGRTTFVKGSLGTSWKPKKQYQNIIYWKGDSGYEVVIDSPFYKFVLPKLVIIVGLLITTIIIIVFLKEYTSVLDR
ncbi:MAG: hypothetical protein K0U54_12350 [Bacteroidetes bacterium]|nr:hypothetical protein [Bacteroidota bacterium]